MRICSQCKINKEDSEFYLRKGKYKRKTDGVVVTRTYQSSDCKSCHTLRSREYGRTARGKLLQKQRLQRYKEEGRTREWYRLRGREKKLKVDFGISQDDFNRILAEQKGVCAVCGRPERSKPSRGKLAVRRMAVDHNHETGEVRGLLCSKCNMGIAQLDESVEILARAITYLEEHKQLAPQMGMKTEGAKKGVA